MSQHAIDEELHRDHGELGRTFQRELVASARVLWGDVLADRCNIPDEKRMRAGPTGAYGAFYGEKRIADLVIPAPGGRTLYIEAKATKALRWEWRKLTDNQREGLRMLSEHGQEAWLLLLFRPLQWVRDDKGLARFVNEVYAFPAWAALKLAERSASVARTWCVSQAAEDGLKVPRGIPSMTPPEPRGWDLRVLSGDTPGTRER